MNDKNEIDKKKLSVEGLKAFNAILIILASITGTLLYSSQFYIFLLIPAFFFLIILLFFIHFQFRIYRNLQRAIGFV